MSCSIRKGHERQTIIIKGLNLDKKKNKKKMFIYVKK